MKNLAEQITELLLEELTYIYCWNCEYNDKGDEYDNCEDCHRKYMNWSLSKITAENLANKIDKLYKEG